MAELAVRDICWVAGLLEGEGTFVKRKGDHNPVIQLVMTDRDVVIRVAEVMGAHKVVKQSNVTKAGKSIYRMTLYGKRAMSWMMTLYSLMGDRRQMQIQESMDAWKAKPRRQHPERKPYSRGAEIVWSREGG